LGTTILANISTRLRVETGDNVLIGGFIITGTQNKKVILRAIGPSLPLPGKLDNPTLELRDSSGALLESNDEWVSSPNKQAIIDSGLAPGNDLESAILRSLPANAAYTAIVRGSEQRNWYWDRGSVRPRYGGRLQTREHFDARFCPDGRQYFE
jgi:hypothetical protein